MNEGEMLRHAVETYMTMGDGHPGQPSRREVHQEIQFYLSQDYRDAGYTDAELEDVDWVELADKYIERQSARMEGGCDEPAV